LALPLTTIDSIVQALADRGGACTPFEDRLWHVRFGSSRNDVVFRLGRPQREEAPLQLPESEWSESSAERARASGAVSFLYWETGVDGMAVVGLDSTQGVVFKVIAGTWSSSAPKHPVGPSATSGPEPSKGDDRQG
jgi:hypothetical protein